MGPKFLLEAIIHDTRTITGKNIRKILLETDSENILSVDSNKIKSEYKFKEIPKDEKWRISMIEELTNVKQNIFEIGFDDEAEGFTDLEIDSLIHMISTD